MSSSICGILENSFRAHFVKLFTKSLAVCVALAYTKCVGRSRSGRVGDDYPGFARFHGESKMAVKSAAVLAQKWARGMQQATQSMKDGVAAVTEAPGEKAAAAQDRWADGVMKARESGKFAQNSRAVSLEEWRRAYTTKGIPRVAAGVAEATPVMEQFLSQLLPVAEASSRECAQMPRGTLADSAARMNRNMENMARFKFQRRR